MFLLYPLINNSLLFFGLSGISVVFPVIRVFPGKSSYRRETSHWPVGVNPGRFAPDPVRPLDVSPQRRFAPGRFAPQVVSPLVDSPQEEKSTYFVEIYVNS